MTTGAANDSLLAFRTSQGVEVRATLLRLTRYAATFEVYSAETVMRVSEVLEDFSLYVRDQPVYSGRAVVQDAINTGTAMVCTAVLDDFSFDNEFFTGFAQDGNWRERFQECLRQWQTVCKVLPEFKVAVADIQTFLIDCRRWMEQVELGIRSSPRSDRVEQECAVIDQVSPQVIPVVNALFDKFETLTTSLPEDQRPVHRSYIQRHLHPIVLCAPFAYRSYRKPLGYAGDYEIVNMMLRDPREGASLFAKLFNVWLLQQGSAVAHRNRIRYLEQVLVRETGAVARTGQRARILNIGCGPAWEVQEFLAHSELSNCADFVLLDFNQETLQHAADALRRKQQEYRRNTSVELIRKSVQQLLKEFARPQVSANGNGYDLVYCAGLFDYLPDRVCKRLTALLYESLAPGGLLLVTNVAPFCPNRGSLELILDWHLIYRDSERVAALSPAGVSAEDLRVESDPTGLNLFLQTRKPDGL
jgi:extracellular factor (EF) 3-hydroxypalmitic acid methyl ester biosynthesis protein